LLNKDWEENIENDLHKVGGDKRIIEKGLYGEKNNWIKWNKWVLVHSKLNSNIRETNRCNQFISGR